MGFVDEYDRDITKYTICLPVGNRPDKTAWTKKTTLFLADMFLQNTYSFYRKNWESENPNPSRTKLPYRFRQNFQLDLAKKLLRKKTEPENLPFEGIRSPLTKRRKRNNCYKCPTATAIRARNVCAFCEKYICKHHSLPICEPCYFEKEEKQPSDLNEGFIV